MRTCYTMLPFHGKERIFTAIIFTWLLCGLANATAWAQCSGCDISVTAPSSAALTATSSSNQLLCIQGTGTYSGNIDFAGKNNVTLCIGTGVTFSGVNFNGLSGNGWTINNYGNISTNINISAGSGSTVVFNNYGTLSGGFSLGSRGELNNKSGGTIDGSSASFNGGTFNNEAGSTFTRSGDLATTTMISNAGTFTLNGNLTINSGGVISLGGTTNISGNLTNNGSLTITGTPTISGSVLNNSGATITGSGSSCNSLCPSGSITNNGSFSSIYVCKTAGGTNGTSGTINGTITGSTTVCSGTISGTLTLSGQSGSVLQWESSTSAAFSSPTTIANTGNNQSFSNLTTTTYYRALVNTGSCGNLYSTTGTVTVTPQTLATSAISGSPFCAGATVSVGYTITCAFISGNVFTAQLSDASGSFASPTSIGTFTGTTSGTISATIPAGTTTGTGYRIRVVGSSPATTGTDNGSNLTINALPAITTAPTNQQRCSSGTVTFTAAATGASVDWSTNGFISYTTGGTYTTSSITAGSSLTVSYRARNTSTNCTSAAATVTGTANAVPTAPTVPTPATICGGSTATITPNTQSGVLFNFYTVSSGGSALNGSPAASFTTPVLSSNTTYYVEARNTTTNCVSTSRTSVTVPVNSAPTAFNVTGGGAYCTGGGGLAVGLSGSQLSVPIISYQLLNNGSNVGSAVMGLGTALNFGNQTAAGTYTVMATNMMTGCSLLMTGSATITIDPTTVGGSVNGGTTVCTGNTSGLLTLSGHTGSVLKWQSSITPFSTWTDIANAAATYTSGALTQTTQFRAVVQSGTCAVANSTATTVTVVGAPVFSLGSTSSRCQGAGSITYGATASNSTGMTYSLSTAGTSTINSATGAVIWDAAYNGTATVTAAAAGCGTPVTATHTVTIYSLPTVTTAPVNRQRCDNGTVSFTAATTSTGATIDWSLDGFATTATTGSPYTPSVTVGTPITVSYRARNTTTGCTSAVATVTGTAYATPTAPTAGNNGPVCVGAALTLNTPAVTGATYSWTGPNSFTSSAQNPTVSGSATTAMAGTYSVTVTINSCTSAAGTTVVTVNSKPTATISGTAAICNGSSTPVSIALTGAQPWSVTYTDGATPTTVTGITSSPYTFSPAPASTLTYTVTAVSDANCTGTFSGSAIITVNQAPAITTQPIAVVICNGSNASFTVGATGTGLTYQWKENGSSITNGGVYAGATSATLTLTAPGLALDGKTYSVVVSGMAPCPAVTSSAVSLTVKPKPTVGGVPANATICAGTTVTTTTFSSSPTGATYSWTNSNTAIGLAASGTGNVPSFLATNTNTNAGTNITATISVTATLNGCAGPVATYTITVQPTPSVTNNPLSKTICSGNLVAVTITSSLTAGTVNYSWSGSVLSGSATGVNSGVSNYIGDSPVNTGTTPAIIRYVLTATNPVSPACPGPSVNYDVTVTPTVGTPVFTLGNSSARCQGAATVNYGATSGNTTGITYTLSAGGTINAATGDVTWTAAYTGTATITATAAGCNGPKTATHTVTTNPLPTITLGTIPTVCTGATSFSIPYTATTNGANQYSVVASGSSPMSGFTTVSNATLPASPINVTIPASTAGTYTFTLTVTNSSTGCASASYTISLSVGPAITTNTISAAQTICSDQTAAQLAGSVAAGGVGTLTYLWESSTTSATTGFSSAAGTNNTQNYQPAFTTQNTWYRRTVADACGQQNVSTTVLVSIIPAPGDPTVFGNGVWNVYAYDNYNITANTGTYRGYYTESSLSFDSGTRWNQTTGSPSDASGYQGCPVSHDYMGAVYKQTGFDGNTYQIDIAGPGGTNGHDDDAYLFVNGILVWSHVGCCDTHTNVWVGILKPTTTVEFRWKNGQGPTYGRVTFTPVPTPTSINPGLIGYNEIICPGNIPSVLYSAAPASGGCYPAYQWQIATDVSGSGNWTNIAGATSLTYTPTAVVNQTTYFRRMVSDACDLTAYTPYVTVSLGTTAGNPAVFGNGIWNAYCYDGGNGYGYTNPLYLGYYVETSLNFDSRNRWTTSGTPSNASGYQGCQVPVDYHVVSYRRQNFTPGTYQLDIPYHDDNVYLYINGLLVFSHIGYGDTHTGAWIGPLDASSTVELKWSDNGGGTSVGALNLTLVTPPAALVAGSIGSDQTICPGEVPVLASTVPASGGCYPNYQWQVSTDISGSGNWTDITGATAATYTPATGLTQTTYYRRAAADACGNPTVTTAYVTVTMGSTQGDPTVFGNNTWNAYAYSYSGSITAPVSTYLGYYVEPLLTFNSTNRWNSGGSPSSASGYLGCQVGVDYHIVSYKRQGFPSGTYQLDITNHDDDVYLYVNGVLVYNHNGCCDSHTNVWTGTLGATSTVEFTWREGGGGSYGGLQLTTITPTIPLSAGAIATDQTICFGATPTAFTSTAAANSSCYLYYQWQSSLNNSTWTDIVGATVATYAVPAGLTQTTYYRRGVTDACGAGPVYSNVLTVTVYQALTAGTIATDQTICTGTTPVALTSTGLPSGGNGIYTYTWQSSTNGTTWTTISGAASTAYAPGTLTTTTYFRRNATTSCTPTATASTTPVLITVTPLPTATGTITGSTAVCQGQSNISYSIPAFANATSYTWAYAGTGATSTSGSFTTSSNTLTLNFSASATSGNLTVKGSNGCGNSATLTLAITVNTGAPNAAGAFTAGLSAIVCQGATAVVYSLNANVTNATSYTWTLPTGITQNGTGASGTVVTSTRSITVDFSNTATSGSLVVKGTNGCGSGTANSFAVTVNSLIASNTVSTTQTICAGQTAATLTGTTPSGGVGTYGYQWQSSPDNSTWTSISGATTAAYAFSASTPSTSTWYRRVVSTTGAGCSNTSAAIQIIVNPAAPTAAATISGTATICQGATGIVYTVPAITNATSYVWTLPTGVTQTGTGLSGTISTATNTVVLDFPSGSASGNLAVYGSNTCGNGITSSGFAIVVNPTVPNAATTISGANTVCQGQTGVTYTVAAIANATSYSWTVPSGATITSGAATNTITVDFSTTATSGNLSVNGVNGCGSGVSANYALVVNPLPASAGTITGTSSVCQAQSGVTYTVPAIANATSYGWVYTGTGVTPSSGTFTTASNTITVDFSASATSGNWTVTGSNACGNGSTSASYAVTVKALPSAAGTISGATAVCQSQTTVVYSVAAIANASSYLWTVPSGASIVAGSGTNSITVNYSVAAVSGNFTVYGKNACGNGTSTSLAVTVSSIPAAAGTITGTAPSGSATAVCRPLNGVVYTVPAIAGATSYYWTLPTGVFSTSGSNVTATNSITVDFNSASAVSGNVTVYGNNSCGNGTISSLAVSVSSGTPSGAGTITGTNAICRPTSNLSYTVPTIGGATSYTWTLPTGVTQSGSGASGTVSTSSNTITVDFGPTTAAGSNTLSVKGINACGVGSQSSYTVTVYTSVPTGTPVITGSTTVCQAQNSVTYSVSGITSATSYTWTLPSGATPASGTLTTAGNSITVNYSTSATSGNVTVTPANPCGNAATSGNYAITVNPLPDTPGSIVGSSLVCQGTTGVTYTVPVINNATQYVWSLPSGMKQSVTAATGVVTTISNSITVDFTSTAVSGSLTVNGKNGGCGNGSATAFAVTVSTTGTWLGGTSDDWNDPANWCGGVPSWTTTVTITTATAPTYWPVIRNAPTAKSNHLLINAGTSVTLSGNYTLDMKGNLTNYGTFSPGSTATVNLSGNATQALSGITTFNNLTISGGGTKTLASDITVNGTLSLQSGLVSTGAQKINVTSSATSAVSGFSSVSYVDGNLQRAISGSGSYDWPVGAGVKYAPINLNIPATTPLVGTASILGFFTNATASGAVSLSESGNNYTSLCGPGYWTLTPDVQPSSGNFDLTVTPASGMSCSGTQSTLVKRPNSAGTWGFYGSTAVSATRRNGFSSFSEVTQATGNSIGLPVRLLTFTGESGKHEVTLHWTTVSELDNAYFEVERSSDAQSFQAIGRVKGSGTTRERSVYRFADAQPLEGTGYYRLRQVDMDGQSTYSHAIAIHFLENEASIEVFPNPIPRGSAIKLKISSNQATVFTIALYDVQGRLLHQAAYPVAQGINQVLLPSTVVLPAGIYIVRATPANLVDGHYTRQFKVVVE